MAKIEVFADVMCPFAYVGLSAFEARRAEAGGSGPLLVVRSWPLERVNGHAHDAAHLAPEIAALRRDVAPQLFSGFDPATFPASTVAAMEATAVAYRHDAGAGDAFALAVRHALFEEGRDVGDHSVLAQLATAIGFELPRDPGQAAVEADFEEGRARGVVGSPHWFVGESDFFCPSLDIHHEGDDWAVRFDREGFKSFLDAAFA